MWGRVRDDVDKMLHQRWDAIMRRCFDPKCKAYPHYGGRGIKVSEEFCDGVAFVNYCRTLSGCPKEKDRNISIDRVDVDRGYERGNLRFATQSQQCRNMRTTVYVTWQGEDYDARTWAEKFCKRYRPFVVVRLIKRGVSLEEILHKDKTSTHVGRRWTRKSV